MGRKLDFDLRTLRMESSVCLDVDGYSFRDTDDKGVICLTYDDTKILCGGPDHTIKMLDVRKGGVVRTFQGHDHWVTTLQMDTGRLISGSRDNTLRMWNVVSGATYPNFQVE